MIGFLRGELVESRPGNIVIDVNGFGINVCISEATREELPAIGNEIKVFTYMSVREDGVTLYGFLRRDTLDLFNLLISVSGVGPKGAQAILGFYSVSDIKYFIVTEDSGKLSKAPTIGKKTAERIIIDLKDKVNKADIEMLEMPSDSDNSKLSSEANDAVDALVALGYDKKDARRAVSMVEHSEELNSNQILKLALQYMFI